MLLSVYKQIRRVRLHVPVCRWRDIKLCSKQAINNLKVVDRQVFCCQRTWEGIWSSQPPNLPLEIKPKKGRQHSNQCVRGFTITTRDIIYLRINVIFMLPSCRVFSLACYRHGYCHHLIYDALWTFMWWLIMVDCGFFGLLSWKKLGITHVWREQNWIKPFIRQVMPSRLLGG